jgi:hypothetical protein
MTVGLPGTGIGGLFYLLSALAMPFSATIRTLRDKKHQPKWRVALAQFGLGCAMLAVLAITGIGIDYWLAISTNFLSYYAPSFFASAKDLSFGVIPTFLTLAVLVSVLILIEIAGAVLVFTDRRHSNSLRRHRPTNTAERSRVMS